MRAGASGKGWEEGRGPRRLRGRQEQGSSMPPAEAGARGGSPPGKGAAAGRRGRWRLPPRPEAGRVRSGSSLWAPRRLWEPWCGWERATVSSFRLPLSCRPYRAGAAAPERFPRELGQTQQLGEEEERLCPAEALADSAQALHPISGLSRRLRRSPRLPGPPLSEKPRPTATRPPPLGGFRAVLKSVG